MKKLFLISVIVFAALSLKAQTATITIPDGWANLTTANNDSLVKWVTRGYISAIPGTKKFYISSNWNPSNTVLNTIKVAGGDTENWPLYWIVNDTTFFYQPCSSLLSDVISIKSFQYMPNKTWGEYFDQAHEMYYRVAPNPDQYVILAADVDGRLLRLSEMINIKTQYNAYIPSYWTIKTLMTNQDKVQRNNETGLFE